jgi:hypothetical protein
MKLLDTWLTIAIQIGVGVVAVVSALTSAFRWPADTSNRDLLLWAVGTLGVLCIAIGFER